RDGAVDRVGVVPDDDEALRLRSDLDDVVASHLVGGNRHPLAVDEHMTVTHELPGLVPARREVGAVHHVVEAQLQHPEEGLAGDAGLAVRLGVEVAELALEYAIDAARLLLLAELEHVLALADATAAVLTRRVRLALDRAL